MIDLRIKELFFDRPMVARAVNKAKRGVLSRAGAFIRQAARTSIRKRQGTSSPGSPPYSHTGLLRRFILFGYDRGTDSVVVGPVRLNKPGEAPRVLELGGTTVIEQRVRGRRVRARARIQRRPYMGPAMEKELPKFPALWRNSIRPG
ncbi:MAG TPA: hypothetical protein PLV57_20520 [Phycisphaerae bacterium]|nr:hypothetical protein [Phycisphaerae bacterium]HPP28899.1 hypothetical protein [Phycisphaerae bacterium]HRR85609.1 hypothetical protein [Phycisphaerae bacterium]